MVKNHKCDSYEKSFTQSGVLNRHTYSYNVKKITNVTLVISIQYTMAKKITNVILLERDFLYQDI